MSDQQPIFRIHRVYLKEASLVQPHSDLLLQAAQMPNVETQAGFTSVPLSEGFYDVRVAITLTAKFSDKVVFQIEATQGGLFEIRNTPDATVTHALRVGGPEFLMPYLRANVYDLIRRAGLPEIHLKQIDFTLMPKLS